MERWIRTFRGPLGFYSSGRPELYKVHQPNPQPRLNIGKVARRRLLQEQEEIQKERQKRRRRMEEKDAFAKEDAFSKMKRRLMV